jgi:hypothetical protein
VVEAQHVVSTMALVDTLDEQALLEQILDESKPVIPSECRELHYLLATPFRYGSPYPTGSRFRRPGFTPGVFYASLTPIVAVSEMAFRRLLFYAESPDTPWPANAAEYTAFSVRFATCKGLDLMRPPLDRDARKWTDPVDYSHCQAIAEHAREAGAQVIRYRSARTDGQNVALLTCAAFKSRAPIDRQVWRIHAGSVGVRAVCDFPPERLAFDRTAFARDPRIASLAWDRRA